MKLKKRKNFISKKIFRSHRPSLPPGEKEEKEGFSMAMEKHPPRGTHGVPVTLEKKRGN